MSYVILIRHGESRWNLENRFTGWVDVPLSPRGIKEALLAGKHLAGLRLDVAFTSKLERAQETLLLILAKQEYTGIFQHDSKRRKEWSHHDQKMSKNEIPIYSDDALNERYYGDLQGLNKAWARKRFGEEQVHLWRRSYDVPPPNGESLKDTYLRSVPYFKKIIMPVIEGKKNVVISAHGNSLRAIIKYIDQISDSEIPQLELPTGKPIIYEYKRGKLSRSNHKVTFDRPIVWD
ncbi:2,3-bisphosphoglycerate-dependent phosphoglycerate mutase [Candidatus Woesearchaeota archaeon]|nr:2,3-bisphosphoglycerate-dependent phosphoglycerate mutase [Candidatus Woesearchaeota archaeon]